MNTHKFFEKRLAVGIIVLFFAMSFIPSVEAVAIKTEKYSPMENGESPVPILEGIKGENDWYVSVVIVSFSYDPKIVDEINYYLNGNWHQYNDNPFTITDDDIYLLDWYWIDEDGKRHDESPIFFKIDQTPPSITLTKKSGLNDQVTFTANVNDPTSGVERVEFYLDNGLQETLTSGPYQWIWTGTTPHSVYSIAYDYAGHSKKSDTLNTPYNFFFSNSVIYNILQRLNYIMFTF